MSIEFWEQPALTNVRTMLTRGVSGELSLAEEIAGCRANASARHSLRALIEVETLQALVYAAQGDEVLALASLRRAVGSRLRQAERFGY